jgi:hypothetical protein
MWSCREEKCLPPTGNPIPVHWPFSPYHSLYWAVQSWLGITGIWALSIVRYSKKTLKNTMCLLPLHLRTETDPVYETLRSLVFLQCRVMDKVQKPSNPECHTLQNLSKLTFPKLCTWAYTTLKCRVLGHWCRLQRSCGISSGNVLARSNTGVVSSIPTRDMNVCLGLFVCLFALSCVWSGLGKG